jgi:hypothetical protein
MQTAADPGVGAGLIVFPDKGGPFPSPSDVPLGFVDAAQNTALDTRLGVGLSLGTPTEDALNGGYGELEAFVPETPLLTRPHPRPTSATSRSIRRSRRPPAICS